MRVRKFVSNQWFELNTLIRELRGTWVRLKPIPEKTA